MRQRQTLGAEALINLDTMPVKGDRMRSTLDSDILEKLDSLSTRLSKLAATLRLSGDLETIREAVAAELQKIADEMKRSVELLRGNEGTGQVQARRSTAAMDPRLGRLYLSRSRGRILYSVDSCRALLDPDRTRVYFDGCWNSEYTVASLYMYPQELVRVLENIDAEDIDNAKRLILDLVHGGGFRRTVMKILRNERVRELLARMVVDKEVRDRVLEILKEFRR